MTLLHYYFFDLTSFHRVKIAENCCDHDLLMLLQNHNQPIVWTYSHGKSQKVAKKAHSAAAVLEMKVSNDKLRDLLILRVFITITIWCPFPNLTSCVISETKLKICSSGNHRKLIVQIKFQNEKQIGYKYFIKSRRKKDISMWNMWQNLN